MSKPSKPLRARRRPVHLLMVSALAGVVSGCAVVPMPFSLEQRGERVHQDRRTMYVEQEPLTGALSLEEAMARSVRYNLDNRLRLMEEALAMGQVDVTRFDMMPRLVAAAGYVSRDKELVSDSRNVDTRQIALGNTTSLDNQRQTADLTLTWNVLDFGVSYFQAQQQADRALIMQERRRKTVHSLMQQVRQAYWQAVGAQALEGKVEPLLSKVNAALADAEQAGREKLRPPVELLNYRKALIELVRQLEGIRDELLQAKPRLAALMNLEPGRHFALAVPEMLTMPTMPLTLSQMEEMALLHRPELIEADYQERIGVQETKKALARMLPGVEFTIGPHYDSNSYLHNKHWMEGGVRVTWNLFNLLSGPRQQELAERQVEVARAQRLALNMAVLTQVHVAYRDMAGRQRQYDLARQLYNIDRQIHEQTQIGVANDAQSRLNEIRTGTSALMADYRRYQNYATLQSAYGQVVASLGVDPLPESVKAHDIASMTAAIRERLAAVEPAAVQSVPASR